MRVSSWLKDLRKKAETDSVAKPDLVELLQLVLEEKKRYRHGPQEEEMNKGKLTQEALASAIQCERFDLYDTFIKRILEPVSSEVLLLLGRALGSNLCGEIIPRYGASAFFPILSPRAMKLTKGQN